MWVCFNNAFISAVESEDDPGLLKIRARNIDHLFALFPDKEILTMIGTDYRHRVFVSTEEFTKVMIDRIQLIVYSNFKNSVDDDDLHDHYAGFWQDHFAYQARCSAPPLVEKWTKRKKQAKRKAKKAA